MHVWSYGNSFFGLKREFDKRVIGLWVIEVLPFIAFQIVLLSVPIKLLHFRRRTYRDSCSPLVIKIPKQEDPYPDATSWTVNEVVRFFEEKGFEEQALAFQEQVVWPF